VGNASFPISTSAGTFPDFEAADWLLLIGGIIVAAIFAAVFGF